MVQLGFVIDQTRCIGCHACTVACKSENEVPVGVFRTWVKYTEEGEFPSVKRSFAVLRCNQCTDAPCVTICPTSALDKRAKDGIVDVNPDACIGCKSCMHGCPYDALHINEDKGTAEKCNFCAHRSDVGLAPACAIVCPTQAILPGDFHDENSLVATLKREEQLDARKVEAGTNPNVFYRGANPSTLKPLDSERSGGGIWSDVPPGPQQPIQEWHAEQGAAPARNVYDVPHPPLWGGKITGYVFGKSLAAGILMAGARILMTNENGAAEGLFFTIAATVFLVITTALLIADLKRPERFLYILLRPNWSSWLTRGSFILVGYGALLGLWILLGLFGVALGEPARIALSVTSFIAAAASASYTAFLFAQAKGRVLWMRRHLAWHFFVQAVVAGTAFVLVANGLFDLLAESDASPLRNGLTTMLALHGLFLLVEGRLAPRGREEEYERTSRLITGGPFAKLHWGVGLGIGVLVPMLILMLAPGAAPIAGLCALIGLWVEEDLMVRAAQLLPIS